MRELVNEFQDDTTRDTHYHDLKYTCLVLFNELVVLLRKGIFPRGHPGIFRKVLETSKIIAETPLMEAQMKDDIKTYTNELFYWHHDDDQKICYRIPRMAKTFNGFRDKKNCKVKDFAIEIVTKMYRLDQQDRVAVKKEILDQHNRILVIPLEVQEESEKGVADINTALAMYQNGKITQQEYMFIVIGPKSTKDFFN
jgi:hypothetical protein